MLTPGIEATKNQRKTNVKFQKGNKVGKGGKRNPPGGRPTKVQQEVNRLAADMVKKYIEDRLRPIMDTYISLASGEPCGRARRKLDPATCRHAVERFIGPAPRTLTLDLQDTVETFFDRVMEEAGEGEEENKERGDGGGLETRTPKSA